MILPELTEERKESTTPTTPCSPTAREEGVAPMVRWLVVDLIIGTVTDLDGTAVRCTMQAKFHHPAGREEQGSIFETYIRDQPLEAENRTDLRPPFHRQPPLLLGFNLDQCTLDI